MDPSASDQDLMNTLYVVWPFSSGLAGKSAAGRHQRGGVSTNPGTDKENTRFEIRMRIFIHSQRADTFHVRWWNVVVAMIFTCGNSVTSVRESERSPYSSSSTAVVAVGCTQLREVELRKSPGLICGYWWHMRLLYLQVQPVEVNISQLWHITLKKSEKINKKAHPL